MCKVSAMNFPPRSWNFQHLHLDYIQSLVCVVLQGQCLIVKFFLDEYFHLSQIWTKCQPQKILIFFDLFARQTSDSGLFFFPTFQGTLSKSIVASRGKVDTWSSRFPPTCNQFIVHKYPWQWNTPSLWWWSLSVDLIFDWFAKFTVQCLACRQLHRFLQIRSNRC